MKKPTLAFVLSGLLFLLNLALASSEVGHTRVEGGHKEPLVLTADLGTESCRVGLWDAKGNLISTSSASYVTTFPRPGWAEQDPGDWWLSFQKASRDALSKPGVDPKSVCAICVDSTACSVVALDAEMRPLRNCLLWCDSRSSKQCDEIIAKGKGDPALRVNCDGKGPISAEWMIPKALWLKQEEPETWSSSTFICEKQDFINWKLTGDLVSSGCNTAARWHFNGVDPPISLLEKLDLTDLLAKWPKKMVPMGELVGSLSRESASALGGLPETGIPVVQGGPDAYVGMLGLGVMDPKRMALITGSSHLHLCVSERSLSGSGFWGAYKDAPMAGLCFAEGGQSSTGSLLQWAKKLMGGSSSEGVSFATLDAEAERAPPGADGLLCLETFQGSRTPETDPRARGALVGLSLFHTRGHVWRSLLEGICLGTRHCISALQKAGLGADELIIGGGASRSPFFLQLHADVTGLPVVVTEQENAPLLGCAVLAAAGAGLFPLAQVPGGTLNEEDTILASVRRAAASMVRVNRRVLPDPSKTQIYNSLFRVYRGMGGLLSESIHSLQAPPDSSDSADEPIFPAVPSEDRPRGRLETIVVPSLLASDHGYLAQEASLCREMGATWVHIDVCDGGETAQGSLTLGPQAVAAIVRAAPGLKTDVHVVANRPGAYIQAMAEAGVTRLTLQWEQLAAPEVEAVGPHAVVAVITAVCRRVRDSGMACGLCLGPDTPVEVLLPLDDLLSGPAPVIEFIDVLAVKPGIGGQSFGSSALPKVAFLRKRFPFLNIGIDGGVSEENIARAVAAGANVLIAGTAVFGTERRRIHNGDGVVRGRLGRLRKLAAAAAAPDASKASLL